MQLKKGAQLQVTIQHLNISGNGIGEIMIDDTSYFVAVRGAVPQDEVLVQVKKIKKKYIEASLLELITPSPHRQPAKSDHATVCGTSPWEVLDYEYQLQIKQDEVQRILQNINQPLAAVQPVVASPDIWFYRNKMQFSFGYDENMQKVLGLHISGRRFDVFDVHNCHLAESWYNQVLEFFRDKLYTTDLVPYSFSNGEGDLRTLTLRSSKTHSESMLILTVSTSADFELLESILLDSTIHFPQITSWYIEVIDNQKGKRTTAQMHHIFGDTSIQETLKVQNQDFHFTISPDSFFQPNTKASELIYNLVHTYANPQPEDIIYDLFCGTGTIGITFAPFVHHVYGLDIVESAIEQANQNLELNNCTNGTYIAEDAFNPKKSLKWETPNTIIVDPPRAGLTKKLVDYIVQLNPEKIVYVSCNIKTFSQDLLEFNQHGYSLQSITPVDQFPHTRHLEIVSLLEKN